MSEKPEAMTDRQKASHYFGIILDLLDAIETALESPDEELREAVQQVMGQVSFTFVEAS